MLQDTRQFNCITCKMPLSRDAEFCKYCGAKVERACPRCSFVNAHPGNFCGNCGFLLTHGRQDYVRPEAVNAAGQPPGSMARLVAFLIDYGISSAIGWLSYGQWYFSKLNEMVRSIRAEPTVAPEGFFTIWAISFFGPIMTLFLLLFVQMALFRTTIGKRVLNIYVVDRFGRPPTRAQVSVRQLVFALESVIGIIYLVVYFREDKRGVHDLAADTYVIERRNRKPTEEGQDA